MQNMAAGSQGGGNDPNNDPYNLADVAAQQGQGAPQQAGQPPAMGQPQQVAPEAPAPDPQTKLRSLIEQVNIAEHLEEDHLCKIGEECSRGFEDDLQSREHWDRKIREWTKLAMQTQEQKAFPWPKASNIKYPLLSTAAMQFAARAYPTLVPSDGMIVLGQVIGKDPDDSKQDQAERISTYMSWDIMHNMDGWEEDMDKMLIELPIVGTMFKKTRFDHLKKKNVSDLIMPMELVVNYWARSLCDAERISEIIPMSKRILKQRQMSGVFCDDVDLGAPPSIPFESFQKRTEATPANDETTPYEIIEQHTYLDLDKDDYREPYIVTFHRQSKKVLRIVARFDESTMLFTEEGKLAAIEPIQYYTKFGFIPSPDGSFYDIGFGMLLGPLNESVNTLINQLVDAGTLNNLQSGFIGKGLRLRMGDQRFQPGEWKAVNATGDDLKKQIVPLPSKEPSATLMQLMGTLVTSGKELASVAEIFTGKMPGQNTPATTTMATVEQGMKVFTAIYKRVYRALSEEFTKLFKLNATYLDPNTYAAILTEPIGPDDFDITTFKVVPAADPNAVSQAEKLQKAQGLLELLPLGVLDPIEVIRRNLIAQEQPNYEKLFNQQVQQTGQMPPPPPDPKMQELQMKSDAEQKKLALTSQAQQQKSDLANRDQQFQQQMKGQEAQQDMQINAQKANLQAAMDLHTTNAKMAQSKADAIQQLMQQHDQHQLDMHQQQQAHDAKLENEKAIATERAKLASQRPNSKNGKPTR